jgi:hypothetical protein
MFVLSDGSDNQVVDLMLSQSFMAGSEAVGVRQGSSVSSQ